jgi:glycosyltransferase involved in cell wall biosynthesis
VLEAFAVGTPVVGTTLGGTAKVLHDLETGMVFPPGDAEVLASQITRICADAELRAAVIANARKLVEETYSLSATVSQIEGFLREAVASAAPA